MIDETMVDVDHNPPADAVIIASMEVEMVGEEEETITQAEARPQVRSQVWSQIQS